MDKWTIRGLTLAHLVATWSRDPGTKVGAYITDQLHRPISFGFNGLPQGVDDLMERYQDRSIKLKMTQHAERNAILFAKQDLAGCILYTTFPPCAQCAGGAIQSGITKIVTIAKHSEFWSDEFAIARLMFSEAGITYQELNERELPWTIKQ